MRRILLRSPEITLKGKNQGLFRATLHRNVRHLLTELGLDWRVRTTRGLVYVDPGGAPAGEVERAVEALAKVAGVDSLGVGAWLATSALVGAAGALDRGRLERAVLRLAEGEEAETRSFAVRVNRVDKAFPLDSQELGSWLGQAIRERTGWDRVDLKRPDQSFFLDIYPDGVLVSKARVEGIGGLPVSTGGHVLSLLSGGIDSPVATYMMAKRGCSVDLFHMSASHSLERVADTVAGRLAARLSGYTLRSRLYVAPYVHFDLAVPGQQTGYELILFRRFLVRTAEALAERIGARALVAGDSLGQVASQTLENLVSTSRAVAMPILRPLVGLNKQEIIHLARRLGTYDIAIEPHKDCCALLASHPRTRSDHPELERLERDLPGYREMIERTLAEMVSIELDCGTARPAAASPVGECAGEPMCH